MKRALETLGVVVLLATFAVGCGGGDSKDKADVVAQDTVGGDTLPGDTLPGDTLPGDTLPEDGNLGDVPVEEVLADTAPDTINNAPFFSVGPCDPPPAGFANLQGKVTDSFSAILSGAASVFYKDLVGDIDGYGRFHLCKVPADEKAIVTVRLPRTMMWGNLDGFTPATKVVTPSDGDTLLLRFRLKGAYFVDLDEATVAAGGEATNGPTRVAFPAAAFVNAQGDAYAGPVKVQLTNFDSGDPEDLESFPGDFAGVDGETEVGLFSLGFVDVQLLDPDQNPLQLAQGKPATLTFAVTNLDPADTTIPMWYFDEAQGTWIREGEGTVDQVNGTITATVSHFTTWNADKPVTLTDCVRGVVTDQNDEPLVGASIYGSGQGQAQTGADGSFCINFYPYASFQFRGSLISDGGFFQAMEPYSSFTGNRDGGQSCSTPEACTELPEPVVFSALNMTTRCLNITLEDAEDIHLQNGVLTVNAGELGVVFNGKMNGASQLCLELLAGIEFSAQLFAPPSGEGPWQEAFCFPKTFNGAEMEGGFQMGGEASSCGGTCDELVMKCETFSRGNR